MIFSGDVVFPNNFNPTLVDKLDHDFIKIPKIVNSESLINIGDKNINGKKLTDGIALSSSEEIIGFYEYLNVVGVSLSNNHITDFDLSIDDQIAYYARHNILAFGAGNSLATAKKPFINDDYVILTYGWDVISCVYAQDKTRGVNPLISDHIFEQVQKYKTTHSTKKIVICFHWDYEFELYPQPAHRKLAFDLIEMGVDAIFGHHSHIVQGAELYQGKPIFYGLGNFYFPNQYYNGVEIKFPSNAQIGLSVEYSQNGPLELFWTFKDDKNRLSSISREFMHESDRIKELTPFEGLSHKAYISWFKKNRKKKKLLPIFKEYPDSMSNNLKSSGIKLRQRLINMLVRLRLK